jgi:hypothetical protein
MALPAPMNEPPPEHVGFWRRHGAKFVISIVIAIALAWALRSGGLPLLPPPGTLERVTGSSLGLFFVFMLGMQWFRATRWRFLLAPIAHVPLRRILTVSFIGYTAILLMPLRAGEIVRPYLIRQKGKVTLAAATGTIGAERVIDGLFLTLVLGICLPLSHPLSPLPDHIGKLKIPVAAVPFYAYLALSGFVTAFVLMAIFYWRPRLGHRITELTVGLVSKNVAAKAADFVARLADGLGFLPSLRFFGLFVVETTLYWACNALSMYVLARGCGIEGMTFVRACVIMGVLGVGILVPAGPGLFGAFQWSMYAALAMFWRDEVVLGAGAAYVFLVYCIQFTWHVLSAGVCLVLDRDAGREVVAAET